MKYDYQCGECDREYEVEVVATSRIEKRRVVRPACPHCKSRKNQKKLFRPVPISFKGTGFYTTDKDEK
jgi:predicted nucleic acid-binding Zn ribbon protein